MEALVFNAKFVFLTLVLANQMAVAQERTSALDSRVPKLENTLNECMAVSLEELQQTQFGTFISATLTHKQSVGKCGCKSAALSYSIVEIIASPTPPKGVDAPEWTRIYVTFSPFKPGEKIGVSKDFAFMLQPIDDRLNTKHKSILRLSCASSQ